jgi:hypothetical protein
MSPDAEVILAHLRSVQAERQQQQGDPAYARRVRAVKAYQHQRFERSYADLLLEESTREAALFFLTDLYGAQDFSARDAQFGRIVPTLDRLFPGDIVRTVRDLAELHALSEQLDHRMAQVLSDERIDPARYVAAWCAVGQPEQRERQIALMLGVGSALAGYTRSRLLRHSLRLMRAPARAAGLEALHGFLERGFDTFAGLRRPQDFLDTLAQRERALTALLFQAPDPPPAVLPAVVPSGAA